MAKVTVAVAFFIAFDAAAATPTITGLYRAGELGVVDMQTTEPGRLVARYKGAGQCAFKPEMQVLAGNFEGDVFLGTVFICQTGPTCEKEKTFPFLAVYHEGALAGDVKLDVGCESPGLEGKRLNIAVATAEDRLLISQDGDNSASSIAGKNANKKELDKAAKESSTQGQIKMKENNFAAARIAFERSITYDDSDWRTWSYLSQVELKLNNVAKGLESIQKAVLVAPKARQRPSEAETGELLYNLPARRAATAEARGVELAAQGADGGRRDCARGERPADPDLDGIREEPEFKKLVTEAKAKKGQARAEVSMALARLGRYELEKLLGRGGMAEVFQARALDGPRRGPGVRAQAPAARAAERPRVRLAVRGRGRPHSLSRSPEHGEGARGRQRR